MKKMMQRNNKTIPQHHTDIFCDDEYGCYMEEFFLELLVFERKRSERSGKPFLVMTVDIAHIHDEKTRRNTIAKTVDSLTMLIRETDVKGWYRNGEVLAVLFTEMHSLETEVLQKKISDLLQAHLTSAELKSIRVAFHRFPDHGKPIRPGGPAKFTFYPDFPHKERSKRNGLMVKRIIDIIGSIGGILIFLPFFIIIPIFIRLTSRGPVLFRQERVGQYEKKFTFLKFRSMYVNNDESVHRQYVQDLIAKKASAAEPGKNGAVQKVFKITNDKRVTRIGKILRKTSLDELPQFINVLRGDMSLAGPRPPIPYELEKYDAWHLRRVLEVKPGITGLWQVIGRSSTTFDEMVRLDLQYASNWSIWLDIKILMKTPFAVFGGKGAY